MGKKFINPVSRELVAEAARIFCEEALVDYRMAKRKAAVRMGLPTRGTPLPDNLQVRDAVVTYQRLYGGPDYQARLHRMRVVAVEAMRLLADFDPRLVGAVISGAITHAHRVQIHAFAPTAEVIDIFLHDRGIACAPGDRDYRYADGQPRRIPLTHFASGDVGIDIAIFDPDQRSRPPLSLVDGRPERGYNIDQVAALIGHDSNRLSNPPSARPSITTT